MLIRGQEYEPRAFGDLQLFAIASLISNVNSGMMARADQHEAGIVLNEVIFDGLSEDIVNRANDGGYVVLLDLIELTELLQSLVELKNKRRGGTEKNREEIELAIAELQAKL